MKKIIEVESEVFKAMSWETHTLDQLIEFLAKLKLTVPGDARMYVYMSGYDLDEPEISFYYKRPETDAEEAQRLSKEFFEKKRIADDEAVMYRILKAKFESDNK